MTEGKTKHYSSAHGKNTIFSDSWGYPEAQKDFLSETIKEMMEAEMEDHPDMKNLSVSDNDDYRNV